MSAFQDSPASGDTAGTPFVPFQDLVDDKAWQHLGMTGEEYRRAWYFGEFAVDLREEVHAMDKLMRTGKWHLEADDKGSGEQGPQQPS